ncbi:MAG TPA: DUF4384 domain-containing protein [Firmicutes bacterium]|nr:DUF4384 domain-containing protein [Bacillota bacterium]
MKRYLFLTVVLILVFVFGSAYAGNVRSYDSKKQVPSTPKYVIVSPTQDQFLVSLSIDRGSGGFYNSGETIRISAKSEKDCYLYLYSIDFQDNISLIFPTFHNQNNFIKANTLTELKPRSGRTFQVGGEGMQILFMVASAKPLNFFGKKDQMSYHGGSTFKSENEFNDYYRIPGDMNLHETFFYGLNKILSNHPKSSWSTATELFFIPGGNYGYSGNSVEVKSEPRASVSIDNIDFGYTPVVITDIPEGEHYLTVNFTNKRFSRNFTVKGKSNYLYFDFETASGDSGEYYYQPPPSPPYSPPYISEEYLVNEIFEMNDGRQSFKREVTNNHTIAIESSWKLQEEITEVHGTIIRSRGHNEELFKMNFFMNYIPYKGQKFVKTVDNVKYTVTLMDFRWKDNDKNSGEMKRLTFQIIAENI